MCKWKHVEFAKQEATSSLTSQDAASISLPPEVFSSIEHTTQVGVFFTLYSISTLFPLREAPVAMADAETLADVEVPQDTVPQRLIASPVLAATVSSDLFFSNTTPAIQINLRLSVLAEGVSKPRVLAKGVSKARVLAEGVSKPRVLAEGVSKPRVLAEGVSKPRVLAKLGGE